MQNPAFFSYFSLSIKLSTFEALIQTENQDKHYQL